MGAEMDKIVAYLNYVKSNDIREYHVGDPVLPYGQGLTKGYKYFKSGLKKEFSSKFSVIEPSSWQGKYVVKQWFCIWLYNDDEKRPALKSLNISIEVRSDGKICISLSDKQNNRQTDGEAVKTMLKSVLQDSTWSRDDFDFDPNAEYVHYELKEKIDTAGTSDEDILKDIVALVNKVLPLYEIASKSYPTTNAEPDENESITPNQAICWWWLNANPRKWKFSSIRIGEKQSYTHYNENGHMRQIPKNFRDAKPGDGIVCYESTPTKQIVGLAKVTKNDNEVLEFEKTEALLNPIKYDYLKDCDELKECEAFKVQQGSLFKLTAKEADFILKLIRKVPIYGEADFKNQVFMSDYEFETIEALLKRKKNLVLEGAPGVGKTFAAKRIVYRIMGEKDDDRIQFVQFHQNYTYDDFVMGYKPDGSGFTLTPGVFYNFCKKAENDPSHRPYFFLIDEINRGNLSKIFGELLMAIEADHRGESVRLAYKDELFSVPKNLYIIGMMNTADRSLAIIDYALRRRFAFFDMKPQFDSPKFVDYVNAANLPLFKDVIEKIKALNQRIVNDDNLGLGEGFEIGHSYFVINDEATGKPDPSAVTKEFLHNVIYYDIIPTLREYLYDNKAEFANMANSLTSLF